MLGKDFSFESDGIYLLAEVAASLAPANKDKLSVSPAPAACSAKGVGLMTSISDGSTNLHPQKDTSYLYLAAPVGWHLEYQAGTF